MPWRSWCAGRVVFRASAEPARFAGIIANRTSSHRFYPVANTGFSHSDGSCARSRTTCSTCAQQRRHRRRNRGQRRLRPGVTVRRGEVETIEYNRDKGVGVTVYIGKQRGHASTSDFSSQAVRDTVDAALSIARFTATRRSCRACRRGSARARVSRSRPVPSVAPFRSSARSSSRAAARKPRWPSIRASAIRKARPSPRSSRSSSTAIRSDFSPDIRTRATR